MAYVKTNWQNGVTPVNADNMNKIENELEALDQASGGGSGGTQLYRHSLSIQHSGTTYIFSAYSKSDTVLNTLGLFKLSEFIIENKLASEPAPPMVTELYVLFIRGDKIYYLDSSDASIKNITLASSDTFSDTVIPL